MSSLHTQIVNLLSSLNSPTMSKLNPHKFESLSHLFEPGKLTLTEKIKFLNGMGTGIRQKNEEGEEVDPERELDTEEELQVWASYVPSYAQMRPIVDGLNLHNSEFEKESDEDEKAIKALLKINSEPVAMISGNEKGNFLIFSDFDLSQNLESMLDAFKQHPETWYQFQEGEVIIKIGFLLNAFINLLNPIVKTLYIHSLNKDNDINYINLFQIFGFESKNISLNKVNLHGDITQIKQKLFSLYNFNNLPNEFLIINNNENPEYNFSLQNKNPDNELDPLIELLTGKQQFNVTITNEDHQVLGGVFCEVTGKVLYVSMVWLHETLRGRKLMEPLFFSFIEQHGRKLGCEQIYLDTCSYQAPWLYKKLGFEEQDQFPISKPHAMFTKEEGEELKPATAHFLQKSLTPR